MAAQSEVVIALNEEQLTERIVRASSRVCFVAPGLYDWVAEALLHAGEQIGWDRIDIVIDPDPFVILVGYGTEKAIKRLCSSGASVRKAPRLRLGLLITDDTAAIFTPVALNIEDFPKKALYPNAVELSLTEASRILQAIAPTSKNNGAPTTLPVIGQENIHDGDLKHLEETLKDTPPVAPDLARQMWVINSQFQIVKITFDGARLSQHKIALRAEHLGFEDADLARRVTGSFKVFEADIDGLLAPLREDLEQIKTLYGLKPIGDLGHVVLGKDRVKLGNALSMFKRNLEVAQEKMQKAVTEELENSRKRLKRMLASKVQEGSMSDEAIERRLSYIVGSMKFPTTEKILSRI